MLLDIDTETHKAKQRAKACLRIFGLDERALQDILFRSLNRLFPDDELILLMQSRRWQEEPGLMAVDKKGNLFIFELEAWESHSSNLLQVLRHGQLYGAMKYPELDALYKKQLSLFNRSRSRTRQNSVSSYRKKTSTGNKFLWR